MVKNQEIYFDGLDFERTEISGGSYVDENGKYYQISHFTGFYVIETAADKEEAEKDWFEDAYLFEDSEKPEIIKNKIRAQLKECAATAN